MPENGLTFKLNEEEIKKILEEIEKKKYPISIWNAEIKGSAYGITENIKFDLEKTFVKSSQRLFERMNDFEKLILDVGYTDPIDCDFGRIQIDMKENKVKLYGELKKEEIETFIEEYCLKCKDGNSCPAYFVLSKFTPFQ